MSYWYYIGSILLICLVIYFLSHYEIASSDIKERNEIEPLIQNNRFKILTASELIECLQLQKSLDLLKNSSKLTSEAWEVDAVPFLHAFLEFVQRLPASEYDHHSGDGGLAKHTIEVAIFALTAANGSNWPTGAKPEEKDRLQIVWYYGIMVASILHDVGKVITSYEVSLYPNATDKEGFKWVADATGSMNDTGAKFYYLDFPEQDKKVAYKVHAKLAWSFFQLVVPASTRSWMAQTDPRLVEMLRSYLTAEEEVKNTPFAQLISKADQASTKKDKKTGSKQRFATAKRKPLLEVMMQALREMLQEKGTYFNIAHNKGGALFRKNDLIYLTCPNIVWSLKDYLQKTGSEYLKSIPTDNQRVYDIFLENGAVEPSLYDPFKAVHQIVPIYTKQDGTKVDKGLSCLCFKLATLYPDGQNLPDEYQGELIISMHPPEAKEVETEPETISQNEPSSDSDKTGEDGSVENIRKNLHNQDIPPPPKKRAQLDLSTEKTTHHSKTPTEVEVEEVTEEQAQSFLGDLLDLPSELRTVQETESGLESGIDNQNRHSSDEHDKNENKENKPQLAHDHLPEQKKQSKPSPNQNKTPDLGKLGQLPKFDKEFIKDVLQETPEEILPEGIDAISIVDAKEALEESLAKIPITTPSAVYVHQESEPHFEKAILPTDDEYQKGGKQFLNWLVNGLADGSIRYNKGNAQVHFLQEGMALVSPKIFSEFCQGAVFADKEAGNLPKYYQKCFQSLKLHLTRAAPQINNKRNRSGLFALVSANPGRNTHITCYLIPNKNLHYFIEPASRPQNNPLLVLPEPQKSTIIEENH